MIDIGWKEKLEDLCVYYMNTKLCIKQKKNSAYEKKDLLKFLLQEPPISKDCLRNSHFLKKFEKNLRKYFNKKFQTSKKFLDLKILSICWFLYQNLKN